MKADNLINTSVADSTNKCFKLLSNGLLIVALMCVGINTILANGNDESSSTTIATTISTHIGNLTIPADSTGTGDFNTNDFINSYEAIYASIKKVKSSTAQASLTNQLESKVNSMKLSSGYSLNAEILKSKSNLADLLGAAPKSTDPQSQQSTYVKNSTTLATRLMYLTTQTQETSGLKTSDLLNYFATNPSVEISLGKKNPGGKVKVDTAWKTSATTTVKNIQTYVDNNVNTRFIANVSNLFVNALSSTSTSQGDNGGSPPPLGAVEVAPALSIGQTKWVSDTYNAVVTAYNNKNDANITDSSDKGKEIKKILTQVVQNLPANSDRYSSDLATKIGTKIVEQLPTSFQDSGSTVDVADANKVAHANNNQRYNQQKRADNENQNQSSPSRLLSANSSGG